MKLSHEVEINPVVWGVDTNHRGSDAKLYTTYGCHGNKLSMSPFCSLSKISHQTVSQLIRIYNLRGNVIG